MTFASTAAPIACAHFVACFAVWSENGAIPPSWWQPVHFSRRIGATSRWKLGAAAGARSRSPREAATATIGTSSEAATAAATGARLMRQAAARRRCRRRLRSSLQISPIVQRTRSASRMGTRRLPVPSAMLRTSASARLAASWSRSALTREVRSSCRRSISGSMRWSSTSLPPLVDVAVDADDDALATLDVLREAERRLLDLLLNEPLLHGRDGAAQLVDALDQLHALVSSSRGQRLDRVRAAQGIRGRRRRRPRAAAPAACAARSAPPARSAARAPRRSEFVCSDWAPPHTAASAWIATRTMLSSGCWAVSVEPPVCAWKRSASARGFVAPNRSRITRAHRRLAARNFATSWRKSL